MQLKNLWLYQFSKNKIKIIFDGFKKQLELKRMEVKEAGTISRENFLYIERRKLRICEQANRAWFDKLWLDDANVFLKMKKWCGRRGVKLVVVALPGEFQVEPELRRELLEKFRIKGDTVDVLYPNRVLHSFFEQQDILFLDLTGPMQDAARFKKLYLVNDTHWNETGNREAGNLIFDFLEKKQLVNFNNSVSYGQMIRPGLPLKEPGPQKRFSQP
jgi:hypothetical protein